MIISFTNAYAEDIKLNDIEKHWARNNIEKLISMGIVDGYKDGTFKPDNTLKFEEFIKMLVTATSKEKIETIQGEKWYKVYIDIALENSYITKDMEKLIDTNIDRKTMAEIIYNLIAATDGMVKLNEKEIKFMASKFTDLKVTDEKVLHIASMGIINGYLDKTFKPANSLKRCEATTVILRVIDESLRTPIEIILPKELSDFPYPDMQYLKNYSTPDGKTVEESHLYAQKTQPYSSMEKAVDDFTNFMGMIVNRDYRTIKNGKLTFNYQPVFVDESNYRTLSYRDWFLYYTNGYKEYKGVAYKDLKSDWINDSIVYNDPSFMWFEYFLDNFIDDTVKNKVIVEGQFYTEPELFIIIDKSVAIRGVLRFKYESHLDFLNIKNELDLVSTKIMADKRRMTENFGVESDYSIYLDFNTIKSFELNQWYEIGLDVIVNMQSPVKGIENIIGEQAQYNYNYIYPIYVKKLN